jgi:hypothetical protein
LEQIITNMQIIFDENLSSSQIEELFVNDDLCLAFLEKIKWANGFECRKCGNDNFCDGKVPHSRRCTRCKNEESATSNTLFHNIKFPVSKAFNIVYQVCKNSRGLSTYDLANQLGLRQMTCWNFRHKVENKLSRIANYTGVDKISMIDILVGNNESPFM